MTFSEIFLRELIENQLRLQEGTPGVVYVFSIIYGTSY
jgi:hypothetical protein